MLFILLGIATGFASGFMGVGGGILLVPALIYLFGYSQHQAQGTTLALFVAPIGFLAARAYYQRGFVEIGAAALICAGFLPGSIAGSRIAIDMSGVVLRRVFAGVLLVAAIKMLLDR